jgi:hypothetical protein
MAKPSAKARTLAHQLAGNLSRRMSSATLFVTESVDTDGCPTITFGDATPATTEQNFFIKVVAFDLGAVDFLGNSLNPVSPSIVQIVTEAAASGTSFGSFLTQQNLAHLLGETFACGAVVEWYKSTNGTVPAVGSITAANKVADFRSISWDFQNAA